jgi:integrase
VVELSSRAISLKPSKGWGLAQDRVARLLVGDRMDDEGRDRREDEDIAELTRWQAACVATGCPGRLFHDLRRSGVRNLVRAGVSEHVAMKISGHKTRSVFDRYDIVSDGDMQEAARRIATSSTVPTTPGTIVGTIGRSKVKSVR